LEIFVAHTLMSAGIRIILQNVFSIKFVSVNLIFGIVISCLRPLLLVDLLNHFGFRYAFIIR